MGIKETLAQDLKLSMKEKDTIRKNTVQGIRAAVLQVEKDKRIELDDEGVLEIIAKELKKRRDVLPEYEKSGREDLIADLNREIEIVMGYLPSQLTREELDRIVRNSIDALGASGMKDIGKIMSDVLPKVKGRADGKMVNEIAKSYLQ